MCLQKSLKLFWTSTNLVFALFYPSQVGPLARNNEDFYPKCLGDFVCQSLGHENAISWFDGNPEYAPLLAVEIGKRFKSMAVQNFDCSLLAIGGNVNDTKLKFKVSKLHKGELQSYMVYCGPMSKLIPIC